MIQATSNTGVFEITKLERFELLREEDWRAEVAAGTIDRDVIYLIPVTEAEVQADINAQVMQCINDLGLYPPAGGDPDA